MVTAVGRKRSVHFQVNGCGGCQSLTEMERTGSDPSAAARLGRWPLGRAALVQGAIRRNIDLEHVIDQHVSWRAQPVKMSNCRLEQLPALLATDTRQDDQARMQLLGTDELAEVDRVLGDDNAVLGEAPSQDLMVNSPERP